MIDHSQHTEGNAHARNTRALHRPIDLRLVDDMQYTEEASSEIIAKRHLDDSNPQLNRRQERTRERYPQRICSKTMREKQNKDQAISIPQERERAAVSLDMQL